METIKKKLRGLVFFLVLLGALAVGGRVEAQAASITMTIERFSLGGSFIMEPTVVEIQSGDTYATLVQRVLKSKNLQYASNYGIHGFYLSGIDGVDCGMSGIPQCVLNIIDRRWDDPPRSDFEGNRLHPGGLYEFCYTGSSGWMYTIDNEFVNGMSSEQPKDGDAVRLMFTLLGGMDLCGRTFDLDTYTYGGTEYYTTADKSELVREMGKYNARGNNSWSTAEKSAYNQAVRVMSLLDASEMEVKKALSGLTAAASTPSVSPEPSVTPVPDDTPKPSVTPVPDDTPEPSVTPIPDNTSREKFKEGKPQFSAAAAVNGKSVTVTWSAYSGADSYEVRRRVSGSGAFKTIKTAGQQEFSYTDKSVEPGTTYNYCVVAVSKEWGESDYDRSTKVKIPAVSESPAPETEKPGKAAITSVTSAAYNKLEIIWDEMENATGYYVQRSTSKSKGFKTIKTIKSGATTSFTDSGLTAGKTYYYKVQAYNESGKGTLSAAKNGKPVPATPKASVTVGKKQATVKWKKISGASGYVVYRSTSENKGYKAVKTITKGSTVSYKNTKLASKKTYYYKVRAYRKVSSKKVYSGYSEIVSVQIP